MTPAPRLKAQDIDQIMERASAALAVTDYFLAARLCLKALERAHRIGDFERMSRIVLPLQEARRQIRDTALDSGVCLERTTLPEPGEIFGVGCYLLCPPLIGVDGRSFRELAEGRRTPALVLTREPQTSAGKWPIVAVGGGGGPAGLPVVVRVQVDPPAAGLTPDWFIATQEALGDAAIAKANAKHETPAPDHLVEDLLELLEAVPDHEKLHQALEAACRDAAAAEPSTRPRRRPLVDDPFSF